MSIASVPFLYCQDFYASTTIIILILVILHYSHCAVTFSMLFPLIHHCCYCLGIDFLPFIFLLLLVRLLWQSFLFLKYF